EASENLATLERTLLDLEQRRGGTELVHEALRAAHTLKGNSAMLGYDSVSEAAHVLEDALERIKAANDLPEAEVFTGMLEAVDALGDLVVASGGKTTPAEVTRSATMRVNVSRLDMLLDLTGEITIARGRLAQLIAKDGADGPLAATAWHLEQ